MSSVTTITRDARPCRFAGATSTGAGVGAGGAVGALAGGADGVSGGAPVARCRDGVVTCAGVGMGTAGALGVAGGADMDAGPADRRPAGGAKPGGATDQRGEA